MARFTNPVSIRYKCKIKLNEIKSLSFNFKWYFSWYSFINKQFFFNIDFLLHHGIYIFEVSSIKTKWDYHRKKDIIIYFKRILGGYSVLSWYSLCSIQIHIHVGWLLVKSFKNKFGYLIGYKYFKTLNYLSKISFLKWDFRKKLAYV